MADGLASSRWKASDQESPTQRRGWRSEPPTGRDRDVEGVNAHRAVNEVIFVKGNLTLSVCCKTFIDLTS